MALTATLVYRGRFGTVTERFETGLIRESKRDPVLGITRKLPVRTLTAQEQLAKALKEAKANGYRILKVDPGREA